MKLNKLPNERCSKSSVMLIIVRKNYQLYPIETFVQDTYLSCQITETLITSFPSNDLSVYCSSYFYDDVPSYHLL
jgi:hypothetical protein